ncbi:MAG: hypothetical protein ACRD6W_18165, partial [Nitrososphaerales archaeon]
MRLPKEWLPGLTVVALADLLIGYLIVESLDSFTGAHSHLPLSSFLVDSAGLAPVVAGTILGAVLVSFTGAFVLWLWRYSPKSISKYLGIGRGEPKIALELTTPDNELSKFTPEAIAKFLGVTRTPQTPVANQAQKPQNRAMRVGDLQFAENMETKPFVEVIQLEEHPLKIYAAVTK